MAYPVSDAFRNKQYSGESEFKGRLIIGNTTVPNEQLSKIEIEDYIFDSSSDENNGVFYIGTFIAQKITIKFKNLNGIELHSGDNAELYISQYVENNWVEIPMGIYQVDELAENYHETCEINLLDYSTKFRQNIDYSPCFVDGVATIDTILQYICNVCDVTLGDYPTINGNIEIGQFDSEVSGKRWISYIAELKGSNAKIGRDGHLYLIPLKHEHTVSINALQSASWKLGEKYEISRVIYDNGLIVYQRGNDTDNTLYLRQDNPFILSQDAVDNIYNSLLTSGEEETENGTSIDLNLADDLNLGSFTLYGNTSQETTNGKNLCPNNRPATSTKKGVTFTLQDDGSYLVNGTNDGTGNSALYIYNDDISLTAGTYYGLPTNMTGLNVQTLLTYTDDTQQYVNISNSSFNINKDVKKMGVYLQVSNGTTTTFNNAHLYPMLSATAVTKYEPYTHGATPNPYYPQLINVVSGNNTISVLGKNFYDYTDLQATPSPGWTSDNEGWLILDYDNTSGSSAVYRNYFTKPMKLQPNKEYTIVVEVQQISGCWFTFTQNRTNEQFLSITTPSSVETYVTRATTRSDFTDIAFGIRMFVGINAGRYGKAKIRISVIDDDTITAENFVYEEYKEQSYSINLGNIELCKIGDYQDSIFYNKNNTNLELNTWYIKKEIGKYLVDISTITLRSSYTNIEYGVFAKPTDYVGKGNYGDYQLYCSHATYDNTNASSYAWDSTYRIDKINARASGTDLWIGFAKGTGLDTIKQRLTNTVIYYQLVSPTYTKVTGELLQQLEELDEFSLFKGTNHIMQYNSNLPIDLQLKYAGANQFEMYSLETRNYGDISLDAWDLIDYELGEETYTTYNNRKLTFEMSIMSDTNVQISNKQQERTTNIIGGSTATQTRKLKTTVNALDNKITLEAEQINTNLNSQEGRISSLEISANGLSTTVSSLQSYTNDELDKLNTDFNDYKTLTDDELGEINSKFDDYATKSDLVTIERSVNTITTDTYTKTEINSFLVDGSVKKIQTVSLTADENGLSFDKTNAPTTSNINEKGVTVKDRNNNPILRAVYDDTIQNSIVETYRHQVHEYFIMGEHSRFEDYEDGTGCFYID